MRIAASAIAMQMQTLVLMRACILDMEQQEGRTLRERMPLTWLCWSTMTKWRRPSWRNIMYARSREKHSATAGALVFTYGVRSSTRSNAVPSTCSPSTPWPCAQFEFGIKKGIRESEIGLSLASFASYRPASSAIQKPGKDITLTSLVSQAGPRYRLPADLSKGLGTFPSPENGGSSTGGKKGEQSTAARSLKLRCTTHTCGC